MELSNQLEVVESAEIQKVLQYPKENELYWIDILAPTEVETAYLQREFSLHPLALEDCLHFDQRPKLEEYAGKDPYLFAVTHCFVKTRTPLQNQYFSLNSPSKFRIPEELEYGLQIQEVHAFLSKNYLITIHTDAVGAIDVVWQKIQEESSFFQRGCDFLYYLVADAICDSNFPILDQLSDVIDEIEEQVVKSPQKGDLNRIYQVRKVFVAMRRTLSPQRDLMALLARHGGNQYIQQSTAVYYRDIYDHLVRINEGIEAARDLLSNAIDTYLSAVGQKTNEIVKRLTILSSIMLPLSFIAGFFGMNFDILPFHSQSWFWLVMISMFFLLPSGMLVWFYRKRWL